MVRRRLARALLLTALVAAACAKPWERRSSPAEPVAVAVENQNFNDATIYALIRGSRIRLGQVPGHSSGWFQVPFHPTEFAFEIDLLAGRSFRTNAVFVSPGDEVQLVVTSDLTSSHAYR